MQQTGREKERKEEDNDYVPVIVKRTDEALRHPDDILGKAIKDGIEQLDRGFLSLFLSAMAAGLILGFSAMSVAIAESQMLLLDPIYFARLATALVYQKPALQQYVSQLETVYDDGRTIYLSSCSFCHGKTGDGSGPESATLIVPPEKLAAVRAERSYLYTALIKGINGSAMPYFTIFDRNKLESLLDYLDESFTITARASAPDKQGDSAAADRVFQQTCSTCHGATGQISEFGRGLKPSPPDFSRFSLTPERAFNIITAGYTGTVMQPFRQLPEAVRWGLVAKVIDLRKNSR